MTAKNNNQVEYLVKARHYGNQVEFIIVSDGSLSLRDIMMMAKNEANAIFKYEGTGAIPTVHIRPTDKLEFVYGGSDKVCELNNSAIDIINTL